jgi:hypothetical protein
MKAYTVFTTFSRRTLIQFTVCSYFFRELITQGENDTQSYKRTVVCSSKKFDIKYKSEDDFWRQHEDNVAYDLNSFFRGMGWILTDASQLSDDGKSIILTKEYKSKTHYNVYTRAWRWFSSGAKLEHSLINYSELSSHLF